MSPNLTSIIIFVCVFGPILLLSGWCCYLIDKYVVDYLCCNRNPPVTNPPVQESDLSVIINIKEEEILIATAV